eukprot:gi/632935175/ref/XP_007888125.1/ PREDICTED: protein ECT2 [Callorhinchus milii]
MFVSFVFFFTDVPPIETRVVLAGETGKNEDLLQALQELKISFIKSEGAEDFGHEENAEFETLYVLGEFEGQIYDTLRKTDGRILGPPVVLHCAQKGEPLPFTSRPLYCTGMLNLVLCFTGFRKEKLLSLVTLVHHMGGTIRKEYTGKVTHLVAKSTQSDKFRIAVSMGTPIMKEEWICKAWENRNEFGFHAAGAEFQNGFKVLPFHDCTLSFIGFSDEEMRSMEEMTEMQGGRYLPLGDEKCTHLVVENTVKQLPLDLSQKLFIVKQEWFWGSIQMDARAGESMYLFQESESPALKKSVSLLSLNTPNSTRKRRRLRDTLAQLTRETDNLSPFPPRKRPSAEASISMGSLLDISNTPESCGENAVTKLVMRHRKNRQQQVGKHLQKWKAQRWHKPGKQSGSLIDDNKSEIEHGNFLEFFQQKHEESDSYTMSFLSSSPEGKQFEDTLQVRNAMEMGEISQITVASTALDNTVVSDLEASVCPTEALAIQIDEETLCQDNHAENNFAHANRLTDVSRLLDLELMTGFQQNGSVRHVDTVCCALEKMLPSHDDTQDKDEDLMFQQNVSPLSNVVNEAPKELETKFLEDQMQENFQGSMEFELNAMTEDSSSLEMSSVSECSMAKSFINLWDVSTIYASETPKSSKKNLKYLLGTHAKQSARWQVAMELYQTESNYVNILTTIIQLFKVPLETEEQLGGPILAQEEIKTIFGSIPDILDVHTKMKADLEELMINWSENHSIGNIVLRYSKELVKTYPTFVNFFEMSKETIVKCEKQKPRFHAFLKINQAKPECGRQSLAELLIRPVQRLPSVALLLNDLRKHTADTNPDKVTLEKAIESLKEVMTHINEDKRKTEGQRQIFDVVYEVDGCPANLLSSHRSLVQRVETIVLSDELCDRGEQVTLFLFNDCLEVARKRHKAVSSFKSPHGSTRPSASLKHIVLMPLSQIKRVLDIKETEDCQSAFALVVRPPTEQSNLIFSFQLIVEEPQKSDWLRLLCRHVANTICKADAENIILKTDPESLEINTKDMDSTFSRASRALKKTSKKVTRAFSFTKTPKRVLQQALMAHSTPDGKIPSANVNYIGSRLASTASLAISRSSSSVHLNSLMTSSKCVNVQRSNSMDGAPVSSRPRNNLCPPSPSRPFTYLSVDSDSCSSDASNSLQSLCSFFALPAMKVSDEQKAKLSLDFSIQKQGI